MSQAALQGRDYVIPDDVKALALPALRHRVILSPAAEIEGRLTDQIIQGLIERVDRYVTDTELAARLGVPAESRRVPEAQLRGADELWLAFSTRGVLPVTMLDGAAVGGGRAGPLFAKMSAAFGEYAQELAGTPAL